MMKKYISFCLAIILCMSFVLSAGAEGENVYFYNGEEVVFEEGSVLSENTKLCIAEMLVDGYSATNEIDTYNLWCNLFGHENTVQIVETIEHKADVAAPRCLSRTWEVYYCTRCETVESKLLYQEYINCCPVE